MTLEPVGTVRSEIKDRKAMPVLGAPAAIELFPAYTGGLLHFEKHSHVWVLAWMHETDRDVVQVTPRGTDIVHGVFSVRSPARPNPIGLTCARVTGTGQSSITLDRLDFIDGTLVIDIKPYFVTRDCVFSARNSQVGRNTDAAAARDSLAMQAIAFTGTDNPELQLAVEVMTHFRSEVLNFTDPEQWNITAPSRRHQFVDALMGITRALPGREELRFHDRDAVLIEHAGARYEYQLGAEGSGEYRFWPH